MLVTGGMGYIGSHTIAELISAGYKPVIADNLANSKAAVLDRLEKITGQAIDFVQADICDKDAVQSLFKTYDIDAVIHFAGLKAVGESVREPLHYYATNIESTLTLCEVMQENGVKNLVFSSSATVYGDPKELPLMETSPTGQGITNPYGQTKYMIEQILKDLAASDEEWSITSLRYFNPIGAHESGTIGEDPNGIPNNLLPYVSQVAAGKLEKLSIFGNDYDTPDGTCIRDYIHVTDLARGHIAALWSLKPGYETYNLGTGKGTSVLELVHAFEQACGKQIPYEVTKRREGDAVACYADATKAEEFLAWQAELSIERACEDSWRWQQFAVSL